jgi:hypothetical protein
LVQSSKYGDVLGVDTDYGPVGHGASNARYVLATDENEYIIKGPSLAPDNPMVGANELIAVRLAPLLGLPVLGHAVIEWRSDWFFASNWMDKSLFHPALDAALFAECVNKDCVYAMAVFDAWLINKDRHNENLIARRPVRRNPPVRELLLNDHSHLMVSPLGPVVVSALDKQLDRPASGFVWLDFVKRAIRSPGRLRDALAVIEGLDDTEVEAVVNSTPDALLSPVDKRAYSDFLNRRRRRLRGVMQKEPSPFPNLKGSI